jgi:hypothetical protein
MKWTGSLDLQQDDGTLESAFTGLQSGRATLGTEETPPQGKRSCH